nr:MAG TPA: hypothetical protein [Caudoviricetes sp.]
MRGAGPSCSTSSTDCPATRAPSQPSSTTPTGPS